MSEFKELKQLLDDTMIRSLTFLEDLPARRVGPQADARRLRESLRLPLPEQPQDPLRVVAELADAVEPGLVATAGPRYFGFVIGGALPAALAADWLATAWDQNAGATVVSPAASVAEEVAGEWLKELLGLPAHASVGFVTGGQMANFTGLAAGRQHVLAELGWDVQHDGLMGAPQITVIVGQERHVTIDRALRLLGLGTSCITPVATDDQGRMRPDALRDALERADGPFIVCAQVGNVNSGAIDPVGAICEIAHEHGAWVHVDGAFGLWAAASARLRPLVEGMQHADSWATDAHKWLNVPYDCGLAFVADSDSHRAAMTATAEYIPPRIGGERDAVDWNPEFSRRARGFAVYAALRSLGRGGVESLIDRCCAHARRFAEALAARDDIEILSEVVLNQVLVRFLDPDGDHDERTRAVIAAVQEDGTTWMGGTTWHGMGAMRISVSNWSTTAEDVDRSVAAILAAANRI
ncbi:MAG TPA: aminotransferase class V-fold PLP-dependent enzyme [Egibacteraceae bacterium]|nr:aminotransferase class V-fold PLP-dependent enzyme [Egibacteraceae bacterium]